MVRDFRTTSNVSSVPSMATSTTATLTTPSTSQSQLMPASSSAPVVSAELTANISPDRLAALNPLINGGFLSRGANQMLGTGNAMVSSCVVITVRDVRSTIGANPENFEQVHVVLCGVCIYWNHFRICDSDVPIRNKF